MSDIEFKKAFREAMLSEFSNIPDNEDDVCYNFSERFNKRIDKLIKSQRKKYWYLINTGSKKMAIICITVFILLATVFSVQAIREPIVTFFTEVYETFVKYLFTGDTTDSIVYEYTIDSLPKDFIQTGKIDNNISITTIFENNTGDIIEFTQSTT